MKRLCLIICLLTLLHLQARCQKIANNWYFSDNLAGISFNSGSAIALQNSGLTYSGDGGTACASDSLGNILFYTEGTSIWNKNHLIMLNGSGLEGDNSASQPAIIIKSPGNPKYYYVFTVGSRNHNFGLAYSIIDITLDNGNGEVIEKNHHLSNAVWARDKLTAVMHSNNRDYWIITRLVNDNHFASFLLTPQGVNDTPVLSLTRFMAPSDVWYGPLKVSHNRKKLISCHRYMNTYDHGSFEVCDFDPASGQITYNFSIKEFINDPAGFGVTGMEISPDSRLLYITLYRYPSQLGHALFQYDLTKTDSTSLLNSRIVIDTLTETAGLQLGPDGKIYGIRYINTLNDTLKYHLDVINDVWKQGPECNFKSYYIDLLHRKGESNFPNFPQDWLYRFVWTGGPCAGIPFNFKHRFIPEPDSIHWDFGDSGSGSYNSSTNHNPTHIFSAGGTYEVYTYVHYPNGRVEETSRELEVLAKPYPNLGPDTLVCLGASVNLTPGSGFAGYYWNGAFTPGNPTYLASDTGTYIVRVKNDLGCYNADTINVLQRPAPTLDETMLNIAPTTCGKSTGAITGLKVLGEPPIAYQWTASGTPLSDSLDIYHLGTGLYELSVTDGYGCTNPLGSYAISDAGNILIDTATFTPSYCGNNDGTLTITAISGLGKMLQYFIKTGSDTLSQWSNGQFSNLSGGLYYVWVTDSSSCSSSLSTPLVIPAFTAPSFVSVASTPEIGTASDGTITITASDPGLSYSLNGGLPQSNGNFTGLHTGVYSISVSNPAGCDTTFSVNVGYDPGILLHAIAGNGAACLGQVARAPLIVNSFTNVKSFDASLNYEKMFVTCTGYIADAAMTAPGDSLKVLLFPSSGVIRISWVGASSLTLLDSSEIVKLVFSSILPGNALLLWDISPAVSHFTDPLGNILHVQYTMGRVLVNQPPKILPNDIKACEGDPLWVTAPVDPIGGVYTYQWQTPSGSLVEQESIFKIAASSDNGSYQYIVTDTLNCADTATMFVTVTPLPVSGFTTDTLYFDERYNLPVTQGYDSYAWNTGDSTYSILVTSEGWYKVTMKTPEGCTSTDSIMMLYSFAPFNMPNAFTPNADGKNDRFRPVTLPDKVKSFTMYIYNRWGQLIFSTNELSKGWDGTFNGSPAPLGVYTYIISYGNQTGEFRKKTGTITLIR